MSIKKFCDARTDKHLQILIRLQLDFVGDMIVQDKDTNSVNFKH